MLKKAPPPPVQPRRANKLQKGDNTSALSSPAAKGGSRIGGGETAAAGNEGDGDGPGPPLPPRRTSTNMGLMDTDDTGKEKLQAWVPLRPGK